MVYRCIGWCMGSRLVHGVQAGVVWCTGWCMVYRLVYMYGVQAGV